MIRNLILVAVLALIGCAPGSNSEIKSLGRSILSAVPGAGYASEYFEVGVDAVSALRPLTNEEEYYLGRSVAARILGRYGPYRNEKVTQYVSKVGLSVAMFSERPTTFGGYHFLVLDSAEINSFAAPGGYVFVTKGLLDSLADEDALAGVLAHEVGHVAARHGLKAISQSNLSKALLVAGKAACKLNCAEAADQVVSAFDGAVSDVLQTILEKGYGRDQEYEADRLAVAMLSAAGYNPYALSKTVAVLEESGKAEGGGLFGSHPNPRDRVRKIERALKGKAEEHPTQGLRAQRFKRELKS